MTQTVRVSQSSTPAADAPPRQPALIAVLRLAALECRAAPKGSFSACALLGPRAGAEEYADALARCLPQMLLRRPVLRRPGAARRSFDEDWLVALARALTQGDRASARFLARRRVRPEAAPYLGLLLSGLSERLYDDGEPATLASRASKFQPAASRSRGQETWPKPHPTFPQTPAPRSPRR